MAAVLFASGEALGPTPAGPALRVAGLAAALARRGLDVTVVAPDGSLAPDGCRLATLDALPGLVRRCRCAIASGFLLERHPELADAPALCADLAGPFLIENLWVHAAGDPTRRRAVLAAEAPVVRRLLEAADLLLCAHARQRDLVIGMLLASAALRPELVDDDPGLERLVLTVPFAAPSGEPPPSIPYDGGSLRLLWPGGLWDWLDPITLLDALADARDSGTDVRAELWGARSPDPLVPAMRTVGAVERRIAELELGDRVQLTSWVPYGERADRLARADLAVTLDPGGIEARYAFRTRLLDALWAGLPTLATRGEWVADEAAAAGAGWTVAVRDAGAIAELLARLGSDRQRLQDAARHAPSVAARYRYDQHVEPLAAWCAAPRRARPGASPAGRRGRVWRRA